MLSLRNQEYIYKIKARIKQQRGRVVKSAVIVIDMVLVQNLLKPFCCVVGKDTLRHFSLLGDLGKQL